MHTGHYFPNKRFGKSIPGILKGYPISWPLHGPERKEKCMQGWHANICYLSSLTRCDNHNHHADVQLQHNDLLLIICNMTPLGNPQSIMITCQIQATLITLTRNYNSENTSVRLCLIKANQGSSTTWPNLKHFFSYWAVTNLGLRFDQPLTNMLVKSQFHMFSVYCY